MSGCRIGRVRMKAGGADVRVLHRREPEPALDIVRMLREMADNIESGDYAPVLSCTPVLEFADGDIAVFGWGETGLLRSIGVLHLGIEKLSRMRLADFE